MKLFAIVVGWIFIFAGVALAAVVLESLAHRRRRAREEALHRQMGIAARKLPAAQREAE